MPQRHKTAEGLALGAWVGRQRTADRNGKLSETRMARLDAVGVWERDWEAVGGWVFSARD